MSMAIWLDAIFYIGLGFALVGPEQIKRRNFEMNTFARNQYVICISLRIPKKYVLVANQELSVRERKGDVMTFPIFHCKYVKRTNIFET